VIGSGPTIFTSRYQGGWARRSPSPATPPAMNWSGCSSPSNPSSVATRTETLGLHWLQPRIAPIRKEVIHAVRTSCPRCDGELGSATALGDGSGRPRMAPGSTGSQQGPRASCSPPESLWGLFGQASFRTAPEGFWERLRGCRNGNAIREYGFAGLCSPITTASRASSGHPAAPRHSHRCERGVPQQAPSRPPAWPRLAQAL